MTAALIAAIAVLVFVLGLWIGHQWGPIPIQHSIHYSDMDTFAHGYNEGYSDAQAHSLWDQEIDDDHEFEAALTAGRCTLPADGWWCSLYDGHDGPCPARPNPRQDRRT